MGTNYFISLGSDKTCDHCGHTVEAKKFHIGKSSAGWCFGLHVEPNDKEHPQNLDDWREAFDAGVITNEYDEVIRADVMIHTITQRTRISRDIPPEQWMWDNRASMGPNNLSRHQLDEYCVGHGDGPFDYISGYFR